MLFLASKAKNGIEYPIKVQNGNVEWRRSEKEVGVFSDLEKFIGGNDTTVRKMEGKVGEVRVGSFHLIGTKRDDINWIILPPGGIDVKKEFREQGYVKNLHAIVEEVTRRNNAKLIAVITMTGEHRKSKEKIENAGYRYVGAHQKSQFAVLQFGKDELPHPTLLSLLLR